VKSDSDYTAESHSTKTRVFVSSVQEELINERTAILGSYGLSRRAVFEVEPVDVDRLNDNQKKIVRRLLSKSIVDTTGLAKLLQVTPQAVRKDLAVLQKMELIEKKGKARATYYVLKDDPSAS